MPQNHTPYSPSETNPDYRYGPSRRLFTTISGTSSTHSKEQAAKLLECARYLNHTGVMLGDHRRVAASHYLNTMIFALLDELEVKRLSFQLPN